MQVNYLSTSTSGITIAQDATIARLPGVAVAAPLEIVGYLLETADIPVVLSPAAAGRSGSRVLVVTSRYTADRGLSAYPPYDEGYVYITTDHLTPQGPPGLQRYKGSTTGPTERLPDGKSVIVCPVTFPVSAGQSSPFQRTSGLLDGDCYSRTGGTPGPVEGMVAWSFPVLVAGIDPGAESELTGLGRAMTSGKYLAEGQGPVTSIPNGPGLALDEVPVLASTASFDGDTDHVTVSLLPSSDVTIARSGASQAAMTRAFGSQPGTPVMQTTITGAAAWRRLLTELKPAAGQYNAGVSAGRRPVLDVRPGNLPAGSRRAAGPGDGQQSGLDLDGRARRGR